MATAGTLPPWLVAHASVTGNGHIAREAPCQDAHKWSVLPENPSWGVAVVSDGAGSYAHSEKGSARVAETASSMFIELVRSQGWAVSHILPEADVWTSLAQQTLRAVADDLRLCAQQADLLFQELSATVIVVVFSPLGLLVAHIGDGRAGGQRPDGKWQALLEPFRGEEANATVFITSAIWEADKMAKYIGTNVFSHPFRAFTLLSDGCERATFELLKLNETTQHHDTYNQPYARFFDPNVAAMIRLYESGKTKIDVNDSWAALLKDGIPAFAQETDDKTLILAVNSTFLHLDDTIADESDEATAATQEVSVGLASQIQGKHKRPQSKKKNRDFKRKSRQ